jgi:hypothetical protein
MGIQNATFVGGAGWDAGTELASPSLVRSLVLSDAMLFGSSPTTSIPLVLVPLDGGSATSIVDSNIANSWGVIVTDAGIVTVSTDKGLETIVDAVPQSLESSPSIQASPVVGANGTLYFAPRSTIVAFSRNAGTESWAVSDAGFDQVLGSPGLDCDRAQDGGLRKLGILYVPARNGTVTAVVVDSPGIDSSASWPKYQHDPRNTGNASTDLSEFACP